MAFFIKDGKIPFLSSDVHLQAGQVCLFGAVNYTQRGMNEYLSKLSKRRCNQSQASVWYATMTHTTLEVCLPEKRNSSVHYKRSGVIIVF